MRVFITGATGFIGSYVCQRLVDRGYSVRALKREHSVIPERLKKLPVEWVEGDLLDIHSLQDGVEGCQLVYHCAGFVSLSNVKKRQMRRVNIEGTENLINVALKAGVEKFGHISSVAALSTTRGKIDENSAFILEDRRDAYGISKYFGEMEVWRGIAEGLKAIIVNPSIVLADDDWTEGSGRFFRTIQKGLRYYPAGSTGFVDVQDVASCLIQLMESEVYNEKYIINSENLPYKEFLSSIAHEMGKTAPRWRLRGWMLSLLWRLSAVHAFFAGGEPVISRFSASTASKHHVYSNEKIKSVLGYEFMPVKASVHRHVNSA